jgi:hypothetical protein
MAVVPDSRVDKISFFENHSAAWSTNAVAIGTTSGAVTALGTLTTAARAAYNAQQVAIDAARAATLTFNNAVDAMGSAGSDVILQIRAKAATAGDGVYALAQIPAPATPGPRPAPGVPTDFAVSLDGDRAVSLRWKCANPAGCGGTIYQVYRRVAGEAEFAYVGGAGTKKFTDATLPAGAASVTYQVQGVRSTAVGPWAQYNVNFGTGSGGGGTMIASASHGAQGGGAKIAA